VTAAPLLFTMVQNTGKLTPKAGVSVTRTVVVAVELIRRMSLR
jgi:hypothetical protein